MLRRSSSAAPLLLLLPSALLLGCGSPPAPKVVTSEHSEAPKTAAVAEDLEVSAGLPPKVFTDKTGIRLEMVFLEGTGQDESGQETSEALIRFTGVRHPLAGVVLRSKSSKDYKNRRWLVPFDGREYLLVLERDEERSDALQSFWLYLPRETRDSRLDFDAEASKSLDPASLVAARHAAVKEGHIDRLAALDRDYHKAELQEEIERAQRSVDEDCGEGFELAVDWDSVGDAELLGGTGCYALFDAIESICSRSVNSRKALLARANRALCRVSESAASSFEDKTLVLAADPEEKNASKLRYETLLELLDLGRIVLEDDRGRILILHPDAGYDGKPEHRTYLGDDKTVYALHELRNPRALWDTTGSAQVSRKKDGWEVRCSYEQKLFFRPVEPDREKAILAAVKFEAPKWTRVDYALARDDRGNYYYVDRDRESGKNYRVFRGQRGSVKETRLMDIVDDSGGMIFATKEGKLRLVLDSSKDKEQAVWIEGKTRKSLEVLPLHLNQKLIYSGLGAYDGADIGTLCY